nr:MarR family transcriptional regulator [uncultured Anaerobutyricum sp.]
MKRQGTGSSEWSEGEPPAEQKVTLEDYQQLIIQMRKANVQFQQMCNIPSGELTMLLTLRRLLLAKAFVIPSDIGDAMKLSRPAVSRMLHNLERKGYLAMKSSEEDHRYVKVQFTQAGRELITEELEKCFSLLERVKERMGEKDMHKFLYYYSEFCSILVDEIIDKTGEF